MKINFEKDKLVKAVNIVQKAVSSRTTMNILECILIDANSDTILLTGNDLELGIQTQVEGIILEKGAIAVNAKLFSDLVKKLPNETITLEIDSMNPSICKISCGKRNYELAGLPADEFTYIPEVDKSNKIELSHLALKDIINQTIFSLAINDINPMMTGELFEKVDGKLQVISLDSHRIALRKIDISENENKIYAVIPGKSLKEIAGILDTDSEKKVNLYFTDKHVLFEFEDTKVVSRILEGTYFNVNQMISNDSETQVKINRKDLINGIDTEMVFIKETDKRPIIFDFKDNFLTMFVNSSLGKGIEEVPIEKSGLDLKIAFNPKFLLEALRVIEDEFVTLSFLNAKSPCFIRDDNDSYLYLILPVNFNED